MLDTTGYDIGPLVEAAAQKYDVPLLAAVAMPGAESGLNPYAERWGEYTGAARNCIANGDMDGLAYMIYLAGDDVSFGFTQLILSTAAQYGIGDGSYTVHNALAVRELLFNRERSIDLGVRHLAAQFPTVDAMMPWLDAEMRILQAFIAYNHGRPEPEGNWFWYSKWAGNIVNYRSWIARAHEILEEVEQ